MSSLLPIILLETFKVDDDNKYEESIDGQLIECKEFEKKYMSAEAA
jgi:hypothetical protein